MKVKEISEVDATVSLEIRVVMADAKHRFCNVSGGQIRCSYLFYG